MRLERLLPLSTPVHQQGRKDERPPRRQPEAPDVADHSDADHPESGDPPDEAHGDGGNRPTPPAHLDITV